MDSYEYEAVIAQTLKAVKEQFVLPLALALGTIVAAICERHPESSQAIADTLLAQAESCRENDAAGWILLKRLSDIAASPASGPDFAEKTKSTVLRLIRKDEEEPGG